MLTKLFIENLADDDGAVMFEQMVVLNLDCQCFRLPDKGIKKPFFKNLYL